MFENYFAVDLYAIRPHAVKYQPPTNALGMIKRDFKHHLPPKIESQISSANHIMIFSHQAIVSGSGLGLGSG